MNENFTKKNTLLFGVCFWQQIKLSLACMMCPALLHSCMMFLDITSKLLKDIY